MCPHDLSICLARVLRLAFGFDLRTSGTKGAEVTPRQTFALSNVLRDLDDTPALATFAETVSSASGRFGTILTVHAYEGWFRWHVSVSYLSNVSMPVDWGHLTDSQREAVRKTAQLLLQDVGHADSDTEAAEGGYFHVRRNLTIEEEKRINQGLYPHSALESNGAADSHS